eukprot:TRINITY_DN7601_c0_g1_i1.p1 TRINITY_DN7601_c0_g1~~TRINITY_DN7601_c0_g1_i1.p1  ORF type:complete len:243 (+),score=34.08 TRINITY_DN7601_c0_g1_i1:172-900(+)
MEFRCDKCNTKIDSKQAFHQHNRDKHGDQKGWDLFKKEEKDKRLKSKNLPSNDATGRSSFPCPVKDCTKNFPTIRQLSQHTKDSHGVYLVDADEEIIDTTSETFKTQIMKTTAEFEEELKLLKKKYEQRVDIQPTTAKDLEDEISEIHWIAKECFVIIECILRKLAYSLKYDLANGTWGNYLGHLKLIGKLQSPSELYGSLYDLKILRNVVSHSNSVMIRKTKLISIFETTESLLVVLKDSE